MRRKQATWTVSLKESVIEDLRWFGKNNGRLLLDEAKGQLATNTRASTRNTTP